MNENKNYHSPTFSIKKSKDKKSISPFGRTPGDDIHDIIFKSNNQYVLSGNASSENILSISKEKFMSTEDDPNFPKQMPEHRDQVQKELQKMQ